MVHYESWKAIYLGVKRPKVKVTRHQKHCRCGSLHSSECWLYLFSHCVVHVLLLWRGFVFVCSWLCMYIHLLMRCSGEYTASLRQQPNDPLLHLVIGLAYLHLASQKYSSKRHLLVTQVFIYYLRLFTTVLLINDVYPGSCSIRWPG